jgi:hypothetical protein
VRELVIVAADLYLPPEPGAHELSLALPALAHVARYATRETLARDWRGWLAAWLGHGELANAAPAAFAAAGLIPGSPSSRVWLATPVHLTATLTSVHLHPSGLLRLDSAAQVELADSFHAEFASEGLRLVPLAGGGFLLHGAGEAAAHRAEPARYLGQSIVQAQPEGPGAAPLARIGAEIEMWLHQHPLNAARVRARELPVSALWLWGAGSALAPPVSANTAETSQASVRLFGDDPALAGLARLSAAPLLPLEGALQAALSPRAGPSAIVLEVFRSSAGEVSMTPLKLLEEFDRRWVAPALAALSAGQLDSVSVLANDHRARLSRRSHLRRWRRPRGALAGWR